MSDDQQVADALRRYLAADHGTSERVLSDSATARALAGDVAAHDPALRNALVGLFAMGATRVAARSPAPESLHALVSRLETEHGISERAGARAVAVLVAAFRPPDEAAVPVLQQPPRPGERAGQGRDDREPAVETLAPLPRDPSRPPDEHEAGPGPRRGGSFTRFRAVTSRVRRRWVFAAVAVIAIPALVLAVPRALALVQDTREADRLASFLPGRECETWLGSWGNPGDAEARCAMGRPGVRVELSASDAEERAATQANLEDWSRTAGCSESPLRTQPGVDVATGASLIGGEWVGCIHASNGGATLLWTDADLNAFVAFHDDDLPASSGLAGRLAWDAFLGEREELVSELADAHS